MEDVFTNEVAEELAAITNEWLERLEEMNVLDRHLESARDQICTLLSDISSIVEDLEEDDEM